MSRGHPACANPRKYDPPKTPRHLEKGYKDCAIEDREERRKEIVKYLDQWVNQVEKDCNLARKNNNDVCAGCFPEFTCLAPFAYKRPFCYKQLYSPLITNIPVIETRFTATKANAVQDHPNVNKVYIEDKYNEIPVWERPRIKSQRLIGGEYKKLTDCFKKNGLLASEYCPRTQSCELIQSMDQWIKVDREEHENREHPMQECCCCPGRKARLPGFTCAPCQPPKKMEQTNYTANVYGGVVQENGYHHNDESCKQVWRHK